MNGVKSRGSKDSKSNGSPRPIRSTELPPPPEKKKNTPKPLQKSFSKSKIQKSARKDSIGVEIMETVQIKPPKARALDSYDDIGKGGLKTSIAKANFDNRSIEPKVQVPFKTKPGETPRKIQIERKKRLYSEQNIELLLAHQGIKYSEPPVSSLAALRFSSEVLPLECFDNSDFEERSPETWMSYAVDPKTNEFVGLPAKALFLLPNGSGQWRQATVVGYDSIADLYIVQWKDLVQATPLCRVHICFNAEDPFNFVERVVAAHRARSEAEHVILYNLFADCMPMDGLKQLDSEQVSRIVAFALNTKPLKQITIDPTHVIDEVNIDYTRTMNRIILLSKYAKGQEDEMLKDIFVPQRLKQPPRKMGCLEIGFEEYAERVADFSFNSFLTKSEIIKVIVQIKKECLKVLQTNLLNIIPKSVKLEEFTALQNATIQSTSSNLKDTWAFNVHNHIRAGLKDVHKGWFNLEETNNEVYKFSKLRNFLLYVNFNMQDTLRFLIEDSLHSYTSFLATSCQATVTIKASNDVEVLNAAMDATRRYVRPPLFLVDLLIVDGEGGRQKFSYSSKPTSFLEAPLNSFDKALASTQDITRVERKVMDKLFWSHEPIILSVFKTEAWVKDLRAKIEENIKRATVPLENYIGMFDEFIDFLNVDSEAYLKDISDNYSNFENGLKLDPLRQLAQQHLIHKAVIEEKIPENMSLGLFLVQLGNVRSALSEKHAKISQKLLEMMATKTKEYCMWCGSHFNDIYRRLKSNITNIEQIAEMKEYMETVPNLLKDLNTEVRTAVQCFDVCNDARYRLNRDTLMMQWEVFGWPKKIQDEITALTTDLSVKTGEYQSQMEEAQESYLEKLRGLQAEVGNLHTFTDIARVDNIAAYIRKLKQNVKEAEDEALLFNSREALFGKDTTEYSLLSEIQKQFEPFCDMWEKTDSWLKMHKAWMNVPFLKLNADEIEKNVTSIWKTMLKVTKFFETQGLTGCLKVAQNIKAQVDEFRPHVPVICGLRNPGMKDRHWKMISDKIGIELNPNERYTLTNVLEQGLQNYTDIITKVSESAGKEYAIETALDKMLNAWEKVNLVIEEYRETKTCILKEVDIYMSLLDEHITLTQAMTFSSFKGPFEERIEKWNNTLQVVSEVIEEWVQVQRNWLYLQPIFDSPDINKQLPTEGKRFLSVDKHWRQTMAAAQKGAQAIKFCSDPKLLDRFRESNKLLDMVQKGLADYLETKRAGFSRFYFLSNDELLEILSQTKDPLAVQPHLKKCFEGIKSVTFEKDLTITNMISSEGEKVPFVSPVDPNGKNIEHWMSELCEMMIQSVRMQMLLGVQDYTKTPRTSWMQKWLGQVVINGSQVHWTRELEELVRERGNDGVKSYYKQLCKQLDDMVYLIRGNLSKMARITIGALAVIDVHARDVMKKMADSGMAAATEFDWISQMRFYWEGDIQEKKGDLKVIMVSSKRDYGYEYLGNSFRLVITPLTDKCYLTIMSALQMILGGAPAGPAGTGKTETTKDLAKALAKQCVVFNCSDGLDYQAMGKFFKGLASSGAWACFDEFNRINIEVLSVIAQQIMTLQGAVQRHESRVIFEETDIFVNPEFAVFITMNPGYAGRSDLPDNLEALFRPVAMMVPDYALIGEIMLFSYGYLENRKCAEKMVATFRLCSEQLSSQDHYDYGMRAVKTVITAAGNLKRANPEEVEEALLLRALQDVNVPKFLAHDLPLFEGIMSDLFPGIERPPFDYGPLLTALKIAIQKQNLQAVPIFLRKNIELYEMICVRHGLMVVGPTGGGKSCNIHVLEEALGYLKDIGIKGERYETVHVYHLNPKSITMGQLYGEFDVNTHEWQDGVLAGMVRMCARDTSNDLQWIVFDGPVDAIWIENMNTVLDDNKKLCLTSGEIMSLSEPMTMMFEPEDLAVASPATVSRCGMIYMEPKSLGFDPLLQSWLHTLPPKMTAKHKTKISILFDVYISGILQFMRRSCVEPLPTKDNCLIQGLMNILDCFFNDYRDAEGREPKSASDLESLLSTLEPLFLFASIWSLCCTTNKKGRAAMDKFLRSEMEANSSKFLLPPESSIYDYCWDLHKKMWVPWMSTIEPYRWDSKLPFQEMIIPTTDSVRYTYFFNILIKNGKHVLMTGPTGTGKTVNISQHLQTGISESFVPLCLTFSAQTSANQTQDLLDGKCEKRKKGVFGPSVGKRFIIFVDDVNMPQREFYGAQPPIELLRQWFDSGGWYDRKALSFRQLVDVIFACACGPPGGGRNPMTNRFVRHFNIIAYADMEDQSMFVIFSTILCNYLDSFDESLRGLGVKMVNADIEIFNTIINELRPTPAKSHYTYNLRDLSKVFQGILMINNKKVTQKEQLCRVWIHENRRVFQDRLISTEDKDWFNLLLKRKLEELLDTTWDLVVVSEPIIFGDYIDQRADPKVYDEVDNLQALQTVIEEYLNEYNGESKQPMDLVMFMDAIEHVSRISRVIRQPQGNALLLGVGGSGRQSLTRLATFMAGFNIFQIEISKGYGMPEWRENIRDCLLRAGVDNTPLVFLFSDTQIVVEAMLEDVNNVLNSGDVPNLYGPEELDKIMLACKNDCVKKKLQPTKLNVYAQYINRVRRNIHVCLCMSPIGDAFRNRLRMFPSIVNCCTIDWFMEWPDEALQSVANRFLKEGMELGDHIPSVVTFVRHLHQSVAAESKVFLDRLHRHNYVTPTSYLELLSTYRAVLGQKRVEVGGLRDRLEGGLKKILGAAEQVAGLQVQLREMEPKLIQTQAEVEQMIVQIEKDKIGAAETQSVVEKEEAQAQDKAAATKEIADDAQRDLDKALPALDDAVRCLKDLKRNDIDEVRNLQKPPAGVKLTLEALCIMFNIKPEKINDPDNAQKKINDYFKPAQKNLLSNANKLLEDMQTYDKENIPESIISKIEPYIADPGFTPDEINRASKACKAMCMWVRAMHTYHQVTLIVEPKKKLLAEAQISLDETLATLAVAQARLKEVNDKIGKLEEDFERANTKKENLIFQVEECRAKLERAHKLISGLGGEKVRWTESVKNLSVSYGNLIGDCLICAGMIAYAGAFTPEYRIKLVDNWQGKLEELMIPRTAGSSIRSTLADPVQIRTWTIAGLPQDGHSIENGIIMSKARRYPLLIDPQSQANRFIKNMGRDSAQSSQGIDVIKLTDKNFLRTLENGIRFGKWVLLENIGEALDAALEPLLLQQKFKQGGTEMIRVGDSVIPWNDSFRFFMTTKLPNPHYPPEVCVKVSLLNFAITFSGLEDQILGVVVIEEMPEMEAKKNALVVSNAKMKKELQEIENRILVLLSASKGDILDDHELIETLATSKKTSEEISAKVAEAEITEKEIDLNRAEYRPVAYRGTLLYFAITSFNVVDPMYQYSLQWFTTLFVQAIRLAQKSDNLQERLEELNNFFTYYLYTNVCRSLFEKDKLLLSFLMTVKILDGNKEIDGLQWRFLISGKAPNPRTMENPADEWIDSRMWGEIVSLASLPAFEGFESETFLYLDKWRAFYDHLEPHLLPLPGKWDSILNSFQKLCVLRCFRADKVTDAIMNFVIEKMGQKFIEPPPFDLAACYKDSSLVTPLIFVLSKGSDPTKAFYEFARMMKFDKKVKGLSLGQGQGVKATRMIEEATQKGTWVYLQNCHLFVSWLTELERVCEDISTDTSTVHKDFRMWLTSMPCKEFPVSILQNGIKMTNEPPKGLKANLRNAYYKLDNDKLDVTSKPYEYKKLLFGLCFFHAAVQERRRFGPLGWNIPYEFNETDLDISKGQLEIFLDSYDEIPYRVLNFLTSYINYGGRVTDAIDLRTIDIIMKTFYCPEILEDDYTFDSEGVYFSAPIDEENAQKGYLDYIESLPLSASPSVFGLHENANIVCALDEAMTLFGTVLSMEASDSSSSGASQEEIVGRAAKDINERLQEKGIFDVEAIGMQYPVVYEESMNTVLIQECIRYNGLIGEMLRTLPDLQKALKGLVVMSAELENMAKAIAINKVPGAWEEKAYPSMKPLSAWTDDLIARLAFLRDWIENGIPVVFWVSGFYFPQAFFTGSLQNYARKHHFPIDTVSFNFRVVDADWEDITFKPEDGCYIRGLFLEGARWDPLIQSLNDSVPKQLYTSFPILHLDPEQYRKDPTSGIYRCPVYKVLSRKGTLSTTGHSTNFIMWIEIPSKRDDFVNNIGKADQGTWIRAGVAAFCSLKY